MLNWHMSGEGLDGTERTPPPSNAESWADRSIGCIRKFTKEFAVERLYCAVIGDSSSQPDLEQGGDAVPELVDG